ncbi:ATP-dependent sacrificial sulfur transferase LarE [Anaerotruncus massiliensis (ex Liu et al. 2021)]|uniref:ATP-dependent sacrificial sulfur transferase LarE n=2 Tax=Anaerotruncus TaxID=244127 RepID=A0A498CTS2_9FIRM|nr:MULTISPECIES: ATP-dependent sacrificial sulfur transferase LarE [Anaerotruncus]MBC3937432.1 ATP-dependent sacrificial sulfur transferase LarE [Anaerotruncus massiliensis (ex Togo et al. 2019)]RLL14552.1 ATP-dependent sacrificial sulfur transferase LarE [Anaerotruncus massiliensis (ex Liu et al. 2021)]
MPLESFFAAHPRVAVAFSGGVDSAYLLYAAKTAGCDAAAYFLKTPFQPRFELEDAQKLAGQLGLPLHIVEYDVLGVPGVAENGPLRCYHCKRALFTRLWESARADGFEVLCDGTNASDDGADRPGMKALAELGVLSPLREAGLSKPEIRRLSREAGLFTHDKPAYACLATRVPTGTPITPGLLERTERAENALFSLGFTDFRVRFFCGAARIQLPEGQLSRALLARQSILDALSPDFDAVLLDLRPRG